MSREKLLSTLATLGSAAKWPWPEMRRIRETMATPDVATQTMTRLASTLPTMSGDHAAWVKRFTHFHQTRVARDLGHVQRHCPPDGRVLDVGAAPFMLSIALQEAGHEVVSLDLHPDRLAQIVQTHGLTVHRCDVEKDRWPLEDGEAQTIAFFEVFEHLRIDLHHTMSELKRVLSPTGRALISTPNLRSLAGLFNFIHLGRSFSCLGDIHAEWDKLRTHGHMGHVREYTAWEMVAFFQKLGFAVEEIIYRGQFGTPDMDAIVEAHPHLSPFLTLVVRHPER